MAKRKIRKISKKSSAKRTQNLKKIEKNNLQKEVPKRKKVKTITRWQAMPLKGSFMVTAIIGFLISWYYVYSISFTFGITCMLFFTLMFVAAVISMTKAPLVDRSKEKI